jgi:hypothetical protein
VAAALTLALAACSSKPSDDKAAKGEAKTDKSDKPSPAAESGPVEDEPDAPPALAPAMDEHFAQATALEHAVIDGDLEAAIEDAKWISEDLPKDAMPEPWQPHLEKMQAAATRVAASENLPGAAMATGELIAACGACHSTLGTGPKLDDPGPVPQGDDTTNRMLRHAWAAARMREGMITDSEERWQLGAKAVSVAPPEPCEIPSGDILPDDVLKLRERIYEIGAEAAAVSGADARAKLYGEYLQTCAGCHVGGC